MSLTSDITDVLLVDGWHDAIDFRFDSWIDDADGFSFTDADNGRTITGPVTSIIAVQPKRKVVSSE